MPKSTPFIEVSIKIKGISIWPWVKDPIKLTTIPFSFKLNMQKGISVTLFSHFFWTDGRSYEERVINEEREEAEMWSYWDEERIR